MHVASLFAAFQVQTSLPDANSTALIVMRWIHFVAGITWVGLLYFFNLVNVPFQKELDATLRPKVYPALMSRAMWWFRWSAVVTVLAGIGYWMHIVSTDARNARVMGETANSGTAIWTFFVFWTLAYILYMGALMAPPEVLRRGPVLAMISIVVVVGAAYAYLAINSHGWESNRLLCIGVGGGIGWFMMFNVWGVIWRVQKRMIQWHAAGTPLPEKAAAMARQSYLASRTNFWLSFPMLFFMASASHYIIFAAR